MIRFIVLAIMFVGVSCGQRGDTVFYKLVTDSSANSQRSIVPSSRMIGQVGHQATLIMSNKGANVCTPSLSVVASIVIEGSFDSVSWFPVSIGAFTTGNSVTVAGQGLYPFISVTTAISDTTNCKINAWYAGTITSTTSSPALMNGTTLKTYNAGGIVTERGARRQVVSTVASGQTATVTATPQASDFTIVVDCVTASIAAVASLTAGGFTSGVRVIENGSPNTLWQTTLGLPTTAVLGNVDRVTQCGLNVHGPQGDTVTLEFLLNDARIGEQVSMVYYQTR